MATTTLTGVGTTVPPRLNHTGVNFVQATIVANGSTPSASDKYLLFKIPNRATVVDWYVRGHAGATTTIFKLGDTTTDNQFGLFTLGATDTIVRAPGAGLPTTYALSDDAVNQFATIQVTVNSAPSPTATASFVLVMAYVAPGNI